MKQVISLLCLVGILLWVPALNADIYSWTDEKGVKHFGNQPPDDAADLKVVFKEKPYDAAADQQRIDIEQREWNQLIKDLEEQEQQQAADEKRRAAEAARTRNRLEAKIAELEEKPLDYFGSQKNKRVRIGYYRYRLETLLQDPDKYFNQPTTFEGNVKVPAQ
jgi:hypothetical protein